MEGRRRSIGGSGRYMELGEAGSGISKQGRGPGSDLNSSLSKRSAHFTSYNRNHL